MKQSAKKSMEFRQEYTKEQVLEDAGCVFVEPRDFNWEPHTYTYTTEPFNRSQIDQAKSVADVQNRFNNKLDEEFVSRYMLAMLKGDKLPALVLFKDEDGSIVKGDGFHTDAACDKLGVQVLLGVYLFADPEAVEVSGRFNVRGGCAECPGETKQRAVRLYSKKEAEARENGTEMMSMKQWAELYRIEEKDFQRAMRVNNQRAFLGTHGVLVDRIKGDQSFLQVGKVAKHDEESAIAIGKLAANYRLSATEVAAITDGFLDSGKNMAQKKEYLTQQELSYKKKTANGTRKVKACRRRSAEVKFKDEIVSISKMLPKLDQKKVKKLTGDNGMRVAVAALLKFLADIK